MTDKQDLLPIYDKHDLDILKLREIDFRITPDGEIVVDNEPIATLEVCPECDSFLCRRCPACGDCDFPDCGCFPLSAPPPHWADTPERKQPRQLEDSDEEEERAALSP